MESSWWRDHYNVLQIEPTSTKEELRKAYLHLSLKWHPDKNPDNPLLATRKFQQIQTAYDDLSRHAAQNSFSTPTFETGSQHNSSSNEGDADSKTKSAFTRSTSSSGRKGGIYHRSRAKSNKAPTNAQKNNYSWYFDQDSKLAGRRARKCQSHWKEYKHAFDPEAEPKERSEFPPTKSPSVVFDGYYGYAARQVQDFTRNCMAGCKPWTAEHFQPSSISAQVLRLMRSSSALLQSDEVWNSTPGTILRELISTWYNPSPVGHFNVQDFVAQYTTVKDTGIS